MSLRMLGRVVFAMALIGCSKSDAGGGGAEGGAATSATPSSSAVAAPSAAVTVDVNGFAGAFRGTLDGKHAIVVHLVNSGGTLDGTYYYVPSIEDLKLHGTVSSAGVVHLDESSKGKPTGAFDGHLGAGDSFDGTWTSPDGTKSLAVHLDPVHAPAGTATVVERKKKSKSKPTKPFDKTQWGGDPVCDVDIAYPDILGSVTPAAAELTLDAELQKLALEELEDCEEPFTLQESYKIITNGSGVLSVQESSNQFAFGAAHPNYGISTSNVSLPSGKAIALTDVVNDAGMKMIKQRLVAALTPDVGDEVKGMVDDALAAGPPDFSLDKNGMQVSLFNSLPHAFQGAASNETKLTKKELAAFRKRPSSVDALWGP